VTLASHLRNADGTLDENPIDDHREIGESFMDNISMKNEQSDHPVENFHKIKPKLPKVKPQLKGEVAPDNLEGKKD
jgi:hypothetical protein